MKNLIITIAFILSPLILFAQENETKPELGKVPKGYQFIKAGINFSTTSTGDQDVTSFSVLPVYGIFVAPNVSVALGVGYSSSKTKSGVGDEFLSNQDGLTFLGLSRQYKHVAAPFYIFLQEDISFSTFNDNVTDISSTGFGIGISPGFNYFMSNNLSIDVTLGRLGYDTTKPDGGDSSNTFGLSFDMFSIGFGVLYSW